MNRKHNTNGAQNQGWVTLTLKEMSKEEMKQIDGGIQKLGRENDSVDKLAFIQLLKKARQHFVASCFNGIAAAFDCLRSFLKYLGISALRANLKRICPALTARKGTGTNAVKIKPAILFSVSQP